MKIEILANKLSDTDADTGQHYRAEKGDTITVPDPYGKKLCDRGWGKDTSGEYASAPFTPGAVRLNVHKATHKTKAGPK
jgi:hypothetical protein